MNDEIREADKEIREAFCTTFKTTPDTSYNPDFASMYTGFQAAYQLQQERIDELEKALADMTAWKESAEMRVSLVWDEYNELARIKRPDLAQLQTKLDKAVEALEEIAESGHDVGYYLADIAQQTLAEIKESKPTPTLLSFDPNAGTITTTDGILYARGEQMTFKIDKVGFYKNRKGERVEIVGQHSVSDLWWWDSEGVGYNIYGQRAVSKSTEHDLIEYVGHWEEPTVGCISNKDIAADPYNNTIMLVGTDKKAGVHNPNGTIVIGTNHKAGKAEPLELEEFAHETDCKSKSKFYAVVTEDLIYSGFYTLDEAQKDAKNRACENPKVKFYIMQAVAAYTREVEIKEIKI